MCRIAGIINYKEQDCIKNRIVTMANVMHHGGPDDEGFFIDTSLAVALAHRRLSLIELSNLGHQPMFDDTNNIVLVFNGEIYNFKTIRSELIALGFKFKSNSDTEVIINAYKQWGINCINRFNGMFAFALLDKQIQKIFLVRDYNGIKPLYYTIQNDELIFSSEMRAFKALNPAWEENTNWKKYFLLFGHLPEPVTTLKDIYPLEKASYLEYDLSTKKICTKKYFTLPYNYTINNEQEAVEKIKHTLIESIERHLISDAPLGLFLSGGLDSSLLTLIAKPFVGNNLKTLSIVFEDEKFSEKKYQDIIINTTGAHHQSFIVKEEDFLNNLPDILEAMDQPTTDSINTYFITKFAKEYGLKAVLSGIGADEIFGGYNSFYRAKKIKQLQKIPKAVLALANLVPNDRIKRITFLKDKSGVGEYLLNRGFYTINQVAKLLDCSTDEVKDAYKNIINLAPKELNEISYQERVSYFERNFYMQNQLLKDTDFMSMWHSVEVRVPFLDKELM
ncbi:MAG: asparagine synthase (glutamine-hydrolyzing), partial [Chitinophagales bacterium]|nr:asparagine synthase (glutamine-hydrolyzing) [Chitinophagales bacterium]